MNNIVLCGFMGTGKTVVGKELAKYLNYSFIDMDELIEQEQKITIKEIFAKYGEEYFRDLEYEICKRISETQKTVVSTGGGTMVYKRNVDVIKQNNILIFLDSSFEVICERIGENDTRPLFQDKNKAKKLYEERKDKYTNVADYIVEADGTVEEVANKIINILKLKK